MDWIVPLLPVLAVHILAAVVPAVLLLGYIYRHDTIEKEPMGLLVSLIVLGVAAALISGVIERPGERLLRLLADPGGPVYAILLAFFVVALVEEGTKFLLMGGRTWNDPNFNYQFDGIVYAAFSSLGFAAFENIQYVLQYGLSVALPRALCAIPGHLSFAVFMGVFYGRARLLANCGDRAGARWNLCRGYLAAVFLHGFYDACAMVGTRLATVLFAIFVAGMYIRVYRLLKRESAADRPICPAEK